MARTTMTFCACAIGSEPGAHFAAGVCLTCGRLNEAAALSFLTIGDGANFSLQTRGIAVTPEIADWLATAKARLVEVMKERLIEIQAVSP